MHTALFIRRLRGKWTEMDLRLICDEYAEFELAADILYINKSLSVHH